jgi:hypothetical protein
VKIPGLKKLLEINNLRRAAGMRNHSGCFYFDNDWLRHGAFFPILPWVG